VEQYLARWNLFREHPITAPGHSERRSGLAKKQDYTDGYHLIIFAAVFEVTARLRIANTAL
jgi:hypothetical protein